MKIKLPFILVAFFATSAVFARSTPVLTQGEPSIQANIISPKQTINAMGQSRFVQTTATTSRSQTLSATQVTQKSSNTNFEPITGNNVNRLVALAVLKAHTNSVNAVAFSPGGTRLASASADGTVQVWNAASGVLLKDSG